jgi:putative transposase
LQSGEFHSSFAMPQSLSFAVIHFVFSTKGREPCLSPEIRPRLWAYLSTVVRNLDAECYRAGGWIDHVHLAVRMPRTRSLAEMVEGIKTPSSAWMKQQAASLHQFSWQRGYGAFSVSRSELDHVITYIDNQEEHHRTQTFQDEFRRLLVKHGLDFDERYVWD